MLTKIMKWSFCAALMALLLAVLWRPSVDYRTILAALVLWAIAIAALKPKARLSIPSITDPAPRSEAL
jgi:hypothetical protein